MLSQYILRQDTYFILAWELDAAQVKYSSRRLPALGRFYQQIVALKYSTNLTLNLTAILTMLDSQQYTSMPYLIE